VCPAAILASGGGGAQSNHGAVVQTSPLWPRNARVRRVFWGKPQLSHTNNVRELKLENQKPRCKAKGQTKASFSTVDFSKVDPLYKCWSVSFYREAGGLFYISRTPSCKTNQNRMCQAIFG
jgi:hypothetical protein